MDTNPKFPRNIHTNRRKKGICMDILLFLPIILLCQEKSSALLLRPERSSADSQIIKACAAQLGVKWCAHVHEKPSAVCRRLLLISETSEDISFRAKKKGLLAGRSPFFYAC